MIKGAFGFIPNAPFGCIISHLYFIFLFNIYDNYWKANNTRIIRSDYYV